MTSRSTRVLSALREGEVCSLRDFYQSRRPNDRNAVGDLVAAGYLIESVTRKHGCVEDEPVHAHHRLIRTPAQMTCV